MGAQRSDISNLCFQMSLVWQIIKQVRYPCNSQLEYSINRSLIKIQEESWLNWYESVYQYHFSRNLPEKEKYGGSGDRKDNNVEGRMAAGYLWCLPGLSLQLISTTGSWYPEPPYVCAWLVTPIQRAPVTVVGDSYLPVGPHLPACAKRCPFQRLQPTGHLGKSKARAWGVSKGKCLDNPFSLSDPMTATTGRKKRPVGSSLSSQPIPF